MIVLNLNKQDTINNFFLLGIMVRDAPKKKCIFNLGFFQTESEPPLPSGILNFLGTFPSTNFSLKILRHFWVIFYQKFEEKMPKNF